MVAVTHLDQSRDSSDYHPDIAYYSNLPQAGPNLWEDDEGEDGERLLVGAQAQYGYNTGSGMVSLKGLRMSWGVMCASLRECVASMLEAMRRITVRQAADLHACPRRWATHC